SAQFTVHLLPIFAILLYTLAGYLYARYLSSRSARLGSFGRSALTLGFVCHAAFLAALTAPLLRANLVGTGGGQSFAMGLGALSAALVGVFLVLEYRKPSVTALGAFVAPLGVMFFLFSSLAFHVDAPDSARWENGWLLWSHIGAALLADLLFALSFVFSAAFLVKERLLRQKRLTPTQQRLPSLEDLDRLNSKTLVIGLAFMSVGVGLGFVFAAYHRVRFFEFDPRLIWSSFLLLVYGIIVALRLSRGIRGRRGAWLSVGAFIILLLSFFGVKVIGGSFHAY
ncbi:MAG: cytochrome c biogenesis protein CcsA, partial [Deltaproteobacteria bacterium]|nr:cytochrome c biogenesis protein CcsA [Deltaproteobacteria bacterium]